MQQRRFLGMPMGWDVKALYPPRMMRGLWNPSDERILRPRTLGIGWGVNFHALGRRLRLIRGTRR